MALKYTEEKRNSFDKETLIQLFLSQQEQLENIDHNLQLVLEQMADLKRHRFGRSSERHETGEQISFMQVDGKIVFFNESEAVAAEDEVGGDSEAVPRRKPKRKQGKREEDLDGLPVVVVEHSMTGEELAALFGEEGFKQLPDEVYRRYAFTPAKIEVEEHHVKVYAGKKTDEIVRAPHPKSLLRGESRVPFAGSGRDECKICQRGTALPSGAGVFTLWPSHFQTEHGELDGPVCRPLPCSPI